MAKKNNEVLTTEQVAALIVGMHTDDATDEMLKANLRWRIIEMNGKTLKRPDDVGQATDRVLLKLYGEEVVGTELG